MRRDVEPKEVLQQAQRPTKTGAIVMDTAGYDISSVTSMVAGRLQRRHLHHRDGEPPREMPSCLC